MNIRVDFNASIMDGTEAVFRSPVDCSQITGLIVYYKENGNTASKEFALADAHGNNVGDIDHLFAENVVVKVILDVTHGMAFVQNADTNAYLEGRFDALEKNISEKAVVDDAKNGTDTWSSNNIVDKLCPPFEEEGKLVQVEPLEGTGVTFGTNRYCTVTMCGKNLYDKDSYPLEYVGYPYSADTSQGAIANSNNYRRTGFIPVSHLQGQTIVLNHAPIRYDATVRNPGMSFYSSTPDLKDTAACKAAWVGGTIAASMRVPDDAKYMIFCVKTEHAPGGSDPKDIQIEIGSNYTEYESYAESKAQPSPLLSVGCIAHGDGIKTVYGIDGDGNPCNLVVKGYSDPVKIIKKLTDAVLSLGGDV